ncbi:ParB N-terminal domain-containing protein [Slackia exigua]|uniref:ParB N-terminal domain-containing protein n=1 Tax=Slackia exigua TaxID=84109 RepID=UPI0028D1F339|nr:ParB N-terminal domain-containing protein [Slackia exigua]
MDFVDEDVVVISCKVITPRPDNRKMDEGMVIELAEPFERVGQTTPVIVRRLIGGSCEIVDGHHRLAAKAVAAKLYPKNQDHQHISCIVRNLTDSEAEIQMLVSNIQMPISMADKGRLFERIGIHVDKARSTDPDAYPNMDRGQAIASIASKHGNRVSKATVYRSINEAHAEDGTHEYSGMSERQRKLVSRMRIQQRKQQRKMAAEILAEKGSDALDTWLKTLHETEDKDALDACMRRIRSAASEIRQLEKRGIKLDEKTAALLNAIEASR